MHEYIYLFVRNNNKYFAKKKTLFCLIFRLFPLFKYFPLIFLDLDVHISRGVYRHVLNSKRSECEDYSANLDR